MVKLAEKLVLFVPVELEENSEEGDGRKDVYHD